MYNIFRLKRIPTGPALSLCFHWKSRDLTPPKTNGWRGPKMMGLGKGNGTLLNWQFLVSMLDFWGVKCLTQGLVA